MTGKISDALSATCLFFRRNVARLGMSISLEPPLVRIAFFLNLSLQLNCWMSSSFRLLRWLNSKSATPSSGTTKWRNGHRCGITCVKKNRKGQRRRTTTVVEKQMETKVKSNHFTRDSSKLVIRKEAFWRCINPSVWGSEKPRIKNFAKFSVK